MKRGTLVGLHDNYLVPQVSVEAQPEVIEESPQPLNNVLSAIVDPNPVQTR